MSDLDKINSIFNAKIDNVKTKEDLQNIKTEFFGKNGQITKQFKTLGSLDPENRNLLQVRYSKDQKKDQDIIHTLMGNDVSIRKEFIISNAIDINNLDV